MKTLKLESKGASGSKTFTIPNPVPEDEFNAAKAGQFVAAYADAYGSTISLTKAAYISTSETVVYPAS